MIISTSHERYCRYWWYRRYWQERQGLGAEAPSRAGLMPQRLAMHEAESLQDLSLMACTAGQ